jgi:hypothetical protein
MSCGNWCVYYQGGNYHPHCGGCSSYSGWGIKPRFELGAVDPFKLASLLKGKQESDRRRNISSIGLRVCVNCSKKSLYYNSRDDQFECLNTECKVVFVYNTKQYYFLTKDGD